MRRTNNVTLHSGTALTCLTNGYDAASRLAVVSDRTNSAMYSCLANSPLVNHITFASNATTVMTTSNKFDYLNCLTPVSSVASGSSVVNFQYQYNLANQRTAVTNVDSSYWVYGHDSLVSSAIGVTSKHSTFLSKSNSNVECLDVTPDFSPIKNLEEPFSRR